MSKHPFVEQIISSGREAVDVFGVKHLVMRVRPTLHGFDVLLGKPVPGNAKGPCRVIITPALKRHMLSYKDHTLNNSRDLPLCSMTGFNIATKIGIEAKEKSRGWWSSKLDDLNTLTTDQFSAKYKISKKSILNRRGEISGPRINTRRVILNEKTTKVLESKHTTRLIADAWGVSSDAVQRARRRLRQRKDASAFEAVA